jgi:hypothetical protein
MSALQVHNALFTDAQLQQRVGRFLVSRAEFPSGSLRVVVRRGVAHLSGQLSQTQQIAQLETACRRVAGVLGVDVSQLTIVSRAIVRRPRGPVGPRRAALRRILPRRFAPALERAWAMHRGQSAFPLPAQVNQ